MRQLLALCCNLLRLLNEWALVRSGSTSAANVVQSIRLVSIEPVLERVTFPLLPLDKQKSFARSLKCMHSTSENPALGKESALRGNGKYQNGKGRRKTPKKKTKKPSSCLRQICCLSGLWMVIKASSNSNMHSPPATETYARYVGERRAEFTL